MGSLLIAVSLLEGEKYMNNFGIQTKYTGSKISLNPGSPTETEQKNSRVEPRTRSLG